jgi:hypothetical protein
MSPEILGIIIGAFIGFAGTAIIAFLSNHFQTQHDKQSRLWEIEDQKRAIQIEALEKRASQCESEANNLLKIILDSTGTLFEIHAGDKPLDLKRDIVFRLTKTPEFASLISFSHLLEDEDLVTLSNKFVNLFQDLAELALSIGKDTKFNTNSDVAGNLSAIKKTAITYHTGILKRLDIVLKERIQLTFPQK